MLFLDSYIKQNVANPEWSKIYVIESAAGGLGQLANASFDGLSVALIFISNIIISPLVTPTPAFTITDNFNINVINFFGFGAANVGNNFYYFIDGNQIRFNCNNANVPFALYYQLIYDRKEKVQQPTSSSAR